MSDKDHAYTLRVIGENLLKEHSAYSSWAQSCKRAADEIESLQSRLDRCLETARDGLGTQQFTHSKAALQKIVDVIEGRTK